MVGFNQAGIHCKSIYRPISDAGVYECYRDRCGRRAKQRVWKADARLIVDMAEAEASSPTALAEEADRARILQMWKTRNTRARPRAKSGGLCHDRGLPPKEEEDSDGSYTFGDE